MQTKKLTTPVYLLDGARTIVGSPFKSLKSYTAVQLATYIIKVLLRRNRINKKLVEEVILGNAVSAGLGQNIARQVALQAGLPNDSLSYTINNVCAAGLQSVILAVQSILLENSDLIIAGGTESATHSPILVDKKGEERHSGHHQTDSMIYDGLMCQITGKHMGQLAEQLAKKNRISREDQDEFALKSHRRALSAQQQKAFSGEIIALKNGKRQKIFDDDRPRKNLKMESLNEIPPAFREKGSVTAGNSSVACDGAAALLVASQSYVNDRRIVPCAKIVGYTTVATAPEMTFTTAVDAIKKCLNTCNLIVNDIDLFEISEAFAAQMIYTKNKLNIPEHKLNVFGGDIAFGHPLGTAGARVLVTLVHALKNKWLKRGVACVSYGGGGAIAMIIESVS